MSLKIQNNHVFLEMVSKNERDYCIYRGPRGPRDCSRLCRWAYDALGRGGLDVLCSIILYSVLQTQGRSGLDAGTISMTHFCVEILFCSLNLLHSVFSTIYNGEFYFTFWIRCKKVRGEVANHETKLTLGVLWFQLGLFLPFFLYGLVSTGRFTNTNKDQRL